MTARFNSAATLSSLFSEPLLIAQEHIPALIQAALKPAAERADMLSEDPTEGFGTVLEFDGDIAVITIHGVLAKFPDPFEVKYLGVVDVDAVRQAFQFCAGLPAISAVIIRVDSPGGGCVGIPECAAALAELQKQKDVYVITESVCASAAYWICCEADFIYATESAYLGSIGVVRLLIDQSAMLEEMGVKVNSIQVGTMKTSGACFKPLSDSDRQYFQGFADKIGGQFRAAVSGARGAAPETMEGQIFLASDAVEYGLCDGIISGFDELLARVKG